MKFFYDECLKCCFHNVLEVTKELFLLFFFDEFTNQ